MMFALSVDFFNGGYSIGAPTSLWWVQLATAVVFGLGIATVLTLVFTPAMLALRVWVTAGAYASGTMIGSLLGGRDSRIARDRRARRAARKARNMGLDWSEFIGDGPEPVSPSPDIVAPLKAAE